MFNFLGSRARRRPATGEIDLGIDDPSVAVAATTRPCPADVADWDRIVAATPGSDVAQLSAWSRVRRDAGFSPLYVLARQEGRLVGGALVLERRLPVLGRIGYVSNGPVVPPEAARSEVVPPLVAALHALARGRMSATFVQPPADMFEVSDGLRERGFRPSVSEIAPAASIRVDLGRSVEDLRGGMSKGNRRRSRAWAERGVIVRTGSADDLPIVAELIGRTAEHQRFEPLSLDYIATLHRELDAGSHVVVFVAELDGVPVSARLCTVCGGVVKQRLSAMDRSERARKEGVAAASVWHAMLWARSNGYRSYDFGGIHTDAARALAGGAPAGGIGGADAFKASFGGEAFLYPEQVELISSRSLRLGYDLSQRSEVGGQVVEMAKRAMRGGRTR